MATVRLNINDLTLGDLADFEEYTGLDLFATLPSENRAGWKPPAKVLVALVWLSGRRDDPSFTVEDARKVKVDELEVTDEDPPAVPPA